MTYFRDRLAFAYWEDYTPTWAADGSDPTIGNGTLAGRYIHAGDLVHYYGYLQYGSTSTSGSGAMSLSLPVTAASWWGISGSVMYWLGGTTLLQGVAYSGVTSKFYALLEQTASHGSYFMQSGTPSFATGSIVRWHITYEAA